MATASVPPAPPPPAPVTLRTGNPAAGRLEEKPSPATFSRFLLPIAWDHGETAARPSGSASGEAIFHEAGEPDWLRPARPGEHSEWARNRRRYWMPETAAVVFDSAFWGILRGGALEDRDDDAKGGPETRPPIWRRRITVDFTTAGGSKRVLNLREPAIVLFEWAPPPSPSNAGPDIHGAEAPSRQLRTGFVIFELWADAGEHWEYEEWLAINELFRYCARPFTRNAEKFETLFKGQWDFLDSEDSEAARYFRRWAALLECPILTKDARGGECRVAFVPQEWRETGGPKATAPPRWAIYPDDRAYVYSSFVPDDADDADDPDGARSLKSDIETLGDKLFEADLSAPAANPSGARWHALLNVDAEPSLSPFAGEWTLKRSYRRWQHYGTLYGFSAHAMVQLFPASGADITPANRHFYGIYFDMLLLELYVRAVLFRFSSELNRITLEIRQLEDPAANPKDLGKFRDAFQRLRLQFDIFTNLYQFPMLSNQQQSVEMYGMLRESSGVNAFFEEVEGEIKSTHDFLSNRQQQQLGETTSLLSVVATVGIPVALIAGAVGAWRQDAGIWAAVIGCGILFVVIWQAKWAFEIIQKIIGCGTAALEALTKPMRIRK